jgi:hypothetical protein
MSGEAVLKPDKDFSSEVDKQLPEAEQLAKVFLIIGRHAELVLMPEMRRVTYKQLSRS